MDAIEAQFGKGKSLYDVLEVQPTVSPAAIKKAYFKVALKCHPDKCPGDEAAKGRFQALSMVHAILSDPERRSLYDETGEVADEGNSGDSEDSDLWFDYWRTMFPKITVADIDSFSSKYKGSEEETRDVIAAYEKAMGNMTTVTDSVLLATAADEERFRDLIEQAIQRRQVPNFAAFRSGAGRNTARAKHAAAKRKAKIDQEAAEAEKLMAKIKSRHKEPADAGSLSTHRSKQFESMVSSLEARYGGGNTSTGAKRRGDTRPTKKSSSHEALDDAEFDRIQKRLGQKRTKQ